MKNRKMLIITTIVSLLPMAVGILFWRELPDQMATHFDGAGNPNGWSSKWFAVFGLPLFVGFINVLSTLLCERDPRSEAYPKKMMNLVYWICPVVSWIASLSIYGYGLGVPQEGFFRYLPVFLGMMFIIMGNYLPKVKPNYYLGIKLPWTYADAENWNRTHRMAGKVWVIGGIAILLNVFLRIPMLEAVAFFGMLLIPGVYSWLYSRRNMNKKEER